MINVNDYKSNVYSCGGEDGIIEYLLGYLDLQNRLTGFVIEFGAADGFHCSNTARLWKDLESHEALLIEADSALYEKLEAAVGSRSHVTTDQALVVNIDEHTDRVADVCSIDVDGNDYYIASRMQTPHQIVVIEHNPTVPPHVDMAGIENTLYGSGALTITKLMESKGYTLVAVTKTNLVFLHGNHKDRFVSDLPTLFDYSSLNYVVTSYDGLYDMIGEFGYGLNRPVDLRLSGRVEEVTRTLDDTTAEYMRQMVALCDGKGTKK
jgi:hypothetical protein